MESQNSPNYVNLKFNVEVEFEAEQCLENSNETNNVNCMSRPPCCMSRPPCNESTFEIYGCFTIKSGGKVLKIRENPVPIMASKMIKNPKH
jgi:hypothetical protein